MNFDSPNFGSPNATVPKTLDDSHEHVTMTSVKIKNLPKRFL